MIKVGIHGYVTLIDYMGSDQSIVEDARMSYDGKGRSADRGLIRYLMRHRHTSPFEMGVLKFEVKMPIFVARQWVRHRMASINEISGRYVELSNEFYIPDHFQEQSKDNKQGASLSVHQFDIYHRAFTRLANEKDFLAYKHMVSQDVSKEQARMHLPLSTYTKFRWKIDLHNLFHFLHLRMDKHSQQEIREFAKAVEHYVIEHFPLAHEAWIEYVKDAHTFSKSEMAIIKQFMQHVPIMNLIEQKVKYSDNISEREWKEFLASIMPSDIMNGSNGEQNT